jgi:hypothetical protein
MPIPVCTGPQGNTCSPNEFRIEIYPGEGSSGVFQQYGPLSSEIWDGRLIVYVDNQPTTPAYVVFGGPRHTVRPPNEHPAHPTVKGRYVLDAPEAHVSGSWPDAEIPTGAFLRREGNIIRTEFTARGRHRRLVVNHTAWYRDVLANRQLRNRQRPDPLPTAEVEQRLLGDIMGAYASSWEGDPAYANDTVHRTTPKFAFNPFGPWSFRLNLANGTKGKQHLHTTSPNFRAYLRSPSGSMADLHRTLGSSHGCVHIAWKDLKELIAKGYAKRGVCVVIHHYEEVGPTLPGAP